MRRAWPPRQTAASIERRDRGRHGRDFNMTKSLDFRVSGRACEDGRMATETRTAVCNLCEAICGLELTLTDGAVTGVRGNAADPLSRGHICPKGVAIADVLTDPDRLTRPVRRVDSADGPRWEEIGWDEALRPRRRRAGRRDERARRRRPRHLPRQPQRAQPRLDDPRRRDGQGAAHAQPLQRHLGRPAAAPARGAPALRTPAAPPDPRPRPHRLLPGPRRQPDGLQRLADDRARLPGPAARR